MLLQITIILLLFVHSQSQADYFTDDSVGNLVLINSLERTPVESVLNWLDVEDADGQTIDDEATIFYSTFKSNYETVYTHPDLNFPDLLAYQKRFEPDGRFITHKTKRRPASRKKEIFVLGHRKVKYLSRFQGKYFPYSNIVRLSTGCTGTLLTPYHVITAAHCVHNGNRYKRNIDMLKIEVPELIGSRLFYVMELNVPVMWKKTQIFPEAARGAYDYAILKLNLPVRGRDTFMHLAVPNLGTLDSDLSFVTFSSNRHNALMQSICHEDENLLVMNGNVLLTSCVSAGKGSSGSALYVESGREHAFIVGILSNTIKTLAGDKEFDAVMLMTERKSADICSMIYPEGNLYNVCDTTPYTKSSPEDDRYKTLKTFG